MLSIIILVLIGVAIVIHDYLSVYFEDNNLPHKYGFALFCTNALGKVARA